MKKTHTLKQCNGVHCRCMNLSGDCPHYHYVDCESRKDTPPSHTENEWREQFAAMEHTRWSKWQSYLHSKCTKNEDGSLTIPAGFVVHWERQIATPYSQLTEAEKESDRREVRPYTKHMQSLLTQARTDWLRSEIEKEQKIPSELQKERRKAKLKITKEHSIYGYDVWRGHYEGASISSGGFQNIHETMQSIREVADRLLDEGWEEVS